MGRKGQKEQLLPHCSQNLHGRTHESSTQVDRVLLEVGRSVLLFLKHKIVLLRSNEITFLGPKDFIHTHAHTYVYLSGHLNSDLFFKMDLILKKGVLRLSPLVSYGPEF